MGLTVDRESEREGVLRAAAPSTGDVRIRIGQVDGSRGADRAEGQGFSVMITTGQDIDGIARGIRERGGSLRSEPADTPWGMRAFRLRDPDGLGLVISSGRRVLERLAGGDRAPPRMHATVPAGAHAVMSLN